MNRRRVNSLSQRKVADGIAPAYVHNPPWLNETVSQTKRFRPDPRGSWSVDGGSRESARVPEHSRRNTKKTTARTARRGVERGSESNSRKTDRPQSGTAIA